MTEELVNLLIEKKLHISFAESLTGGLCASKIISVSDASKIISESYITYQDSAKIKILNVPKEIVDKYTVISAECAYYMAKGLHEITDSDICVSLTGLAGPNGDGIHDVGTVFIGIYYNNDCLIKSLKLGNLGRNVVREMAADEAIKLVYEVISHA